MSNLLFFDALGPGTPAVPVMCASVVCVLGVHCMAKAKEKAKEENTEEPPEGRKRKKGLLVIILLSLVLLGGGGAAWYFLLGHKGVPGVEKPKPKPPVFERLEAFTVNLAGDQERYLQVEIALKLSDSSVSDEIKLYMPEIRDAMLRLLSAQKAADIATAEGKSKLSNEIRQRINKVLGVKSADRGVVGVLFLSFIIQ